ncbi:MAG TPA: hypothetical protein H9969_08325 [Candidatus Barnesiella merdipullorum]|nr:hypothetical protein [Candidatus Barnesiella merdipullorum]
MAQSYWRDIVARPLKKEKLEECVAERLQYDPTLDELMALALGNTPEAFRASRCVALVYEWERPLFLKYKSRFVTDFAQVVHPGVRRIYACLLQHLLARGEYNPDRESAEHLAEVVCDWSVEPGVKLSTLVWTLSILNDLASQVEWAEAMMWQLVELNDVDRSPGMRALLRRVRQSFKIA